MRGPYSQPAQNNLTVSVYGPRSSLRETGTRTAACFGYGVIFRTCEERLCGVYMLASGKHGTLYVGVSADLLRRLWEHREGRSIFTARYNVKRLVWYERIDSLDLARQREKQIKKWRRDWKTNLIERTNPIGTTSFRS